MSSGVQPDTVVKRLGSADRDLARALFLTMASVFEGEEAEVLGDAYLDCLLAKEEFYALAALSGSEVLGGLTAHVLPMTRSEAHELFLYDLAVKPEHQRKGVGRRLVESLVAEGRKAGVTCVFVPADLEDEGAIEFYRAIEGEEAPVAIFTWPIEK
jgi:aminoglycoside 3-N-acetyltransferase I